MPSEQEDEIEAEAELLAYPEWAEQDEQRRAFALQCMTSCGDAPSIDGHVFVANLVLVDAWLKTGAAPTKERKLKPV